MVPWQPLALEAHPDRALCHRIHSLQCRRDPVAVAGRGSRFHCERISGGDWFAPLERVERNFAGRGARSRQPRPFDVHSFIELADRDREMAGLISSRAAPGDLTELGDRIDRLHPQPELYRSFMLYVDLHVMCGRASDQSWDSDGDLVLAPGPCGGCDGRSLCLGHAGLAFPRDDSLPQTT